MANDKQYYMGRYMGSEIEEIDMDQLDDASKRRIVQAVDENSKWTNRKIAQATILHHGHFGNIIKTETGRLFGWQRDLEVLHVWINRVSHEIEIEVRVVASGHEKWMMVHRYTPKGQPRNENNIAHGKFVEGVSDKD